MSASLGRPKYLAKILAIYLGVVVLAGLLLFSVILLVLAAPAGVQSGSADARTDQLSFILGALLSLVVVVAGALLLARESRRIQSEKVRGDFYGRLSHELKTPVTMIKMFAESLSARNSLGEEDRSRCARMIVLQTGLLENMMDRLLAYSTLAAGKRRYSFKSTGFSETLEVVMESCASYLRLSGFEVETDLRQELPTVRYDPEAVVEAVLNLIDNARKFSGKDKRILFRSAVTAKDVHVEVYSTGEGVPEAERDAIFTAFYRASNVEGDIPGQGIGLYLTSKIMRAHGGRVESEYGTGSSCFRLSFPILAGNEKGMRVAPAVAQGRTEHLKAEDASEEGFRFSPLR